MQRFPVLLATAGLLLIAAACTTSVTSSGPPSAAPGAASPTAFASSGPASSVAPSRAALSPSASSAGGDAAAWCAIVIDINTRAGYMVDKAYINAPTAAMTKQVVLEALARRDELLSITPLGIHAAMATLLAYYQALADWASQNGWDALATSGSAPVPPDVLLGATAPLVIFQKTQCGIKFG